MRGVREDTRDRGSEKALLVLGSMDEFVPLVERAHERGLSVVVCDGYADGPAKALADARYDVNVRDVEAVAQIARHEHVDAIVTAYSDVLAECASAIAQRADLPFYLPPERLVVLRDKSLMKRMFDELGVPYPRTAVVRQETLAADLSPLAFPVVTKPLDAWGSHGVFLLETPEEVAERFDEVAAYSGGDAILVEEYNDGFEFNMMTWVVDGTPVVLEIADREKSAEIAHVTPHVSRIVYPSVLTDLVLDDAREIVSRVARHVGLVNGPLCMQFFWSPERGIQVCECAGRVFGYEHELLELASAGALSVEELLLDTALDPEGLRRRLRGHDPHLARCAAGLYFHGYEGRIASVEGVPAQDVPGGVAQVIRYYEPGDEISHAVGAKPYVIRAYLTADTRERLDALTDTFFSSVSVRDDAGREMLYHNERTDYGRALARGGAQG